MAHTLKRAIEAVRAANDRDYRLFGLDRKELLAALEALSEGLNRADRKDNLPTAIVVRTSPTEERAEPDVAGPESKMAA
jgi:hypothetical protein